MCRGLFAAAHKHAIRVSTWGTFVAGQHQVTTATEAAQSSRPLAGPLAGTLFSVGLIGSGSLAIPVLIGSSAYALSEAFGWKYGLNKKPSQAKQFYAIIVGATGMS